MAVRVREEASISYRLFAAIKEKTTDFQLKEVKQPASRIPLARSGSTEVRPRGSCLLGSNTLTGE